MLPRVALPPSHLHPPTREEHSNGERVFCATSRSLLLRFLHTGGRTETHPQLLRLCPEWDPSTAAIPLHLALVELESTKEDISQSFCSLQPADFT